jgi:3,4-dihydroxy 2-butanone 4-phosphate synthase/GTP cyclohydrolase II
MVSHNDAPLATAFTVSVDVRHGLTTGISAEERCNTVRALANANIGAADFVRPGHVFPLISRPGGVLMRSGHTEAATDLCRLAGLEPVGLISELVNDNGTVKRGVQVSDFAKQHDLVMCSVADLIAYRQSQETLVSLVETFSVNTAVGAATAHVFATPFDAVQHVALSFGAVDTADAVSVRLHQENVLNDVFRDGKSIEAILERLKAAPAGVFVYLREGSAGVPRQSPSRRSEPQQEQTGTDVQRLQEWREVGLGAQILRQMGISRIRLLASKERHYVGLSGFGIEIAETELI